MEYEITAPRDADKAFACDSWRRSQQDAPAYSGMPTRAYVAWANTIIKGFVGTHHERLELRPGSFLLVARDKERPRYIHGWALFTQHAKGLTLVYVFTKREHRRQGVCNALLAVAMEQSGEPLTHYASRTRFDRVWEGLGLTFQPVQDLEAA